MRDERVHAAVIAKVQAACREAGLDPRGCVPSPIKGATSGNKEFLARFQFTGTGDAGARLNDAVPEVSKSGAGPPHGP